jgi:hypothetical protein
MNSGLLMADQHVPQTRFRVQGVVQRQNRASGIAKHGIRAEIEQGTDQYRGTIRC